MISKTSLFNKGIYKSTIRRFFWGSVLYFVILFMTTSLNILMTVVPENNYVDQGWFFSEMEFVLKGLHRFLGFSLLVSFGVSTVVAMLVFRFAHSKKAAMFVHSLPVSRTANYISTILGAFTLMAIPVILNGLVLIAISCFGYSLFFDITACLVWMGINLFSLFIMFSCSTLAAMLSGNTFGLVGVNVLIHAGPVVLVTCFSYIAHMFLYGYGSTNAVLEAVTEWNFVGFLAELTISNFSIYRFISMIVLAILIYVLAWVLYKRRKLEKAEDIAAFRCLNPIFRYLVTIVVTVASFVIFFQNIMFNPVAGILPTVILSIVVYFGVEMLLKKSFRVWRVYKGYLVFAAAFTAIVSLMAFTNFFGYETRIPVAGEVEGVYLNNEYRAYSYYDEEHKVYLSEQEVIEYIIDLHEEQIGNGNIPFMKTSEYNVYEFSFEYKLKDGGTISRTYEITMEESEKIREHLYKFDSYRMAVEDVFRVKDEWLVEIDYNDGVYLNDKREMAELMNCLRKDTLEVKEPRNSYMDAHSGMQIAYKEQKDEPWSQRDYIYIDINSEYKNTLDYLEKKLRSDALNAVNTSKAYVVSAEQLEYSVHVGMCSRVFTGELNQIVDQNAKKVLYEMVMKKGNLLNTQGDYYLCSIEKDSMVRLLVALEPSEAQSLMGNAEKQN